MREFKIFIAGCTVCELITKLSRDLQTELYLTEMIGRYYCFDIDIV